MFKWLFEGIGDRNSRLTRIFAIFSILLFADQFSQISLYYINSRLYSRTLYYLIIVLFCCLVALLCRMRDRNCYVPIACRNMVSWGVFFGLWLVTSTALFGLSDYKVAFRSLFHYVWFVTAIFFVCRHINATKMIRFYLITYYILCLVMLITINSNVTTFNFAEGEFRTVDEFRMTSSLAYLIKNGLYIGLYLFIVGLVKGRVLGGVSRLFCVFAVVPYLYFMVVQFKFRTGAILVIAVLLFVAFNAIKRMKVALLAIIAMLAMAGIVVVFSTDVFTGFLERVEAKNNEYANVNSMGFWEGERFLEVQLMLEELSPLEHCIGRGFDAHWDSSAIFGEAAGSIWRGVHMGVFGNVLFGGWPLMVFWTCVYLGAMFKRIDPNSWYADDLRVCKIFVTLLLIRNITGPVPFVAPEYADLPQYLSLGMLWMVERGRIGWLDMKGPYA